MSARVILRTVAAGMCVAAVTGGMPGLVLVAAGLWLGTGR